MRNLSLMQHEIAIGTAKLAFNSTDISEIKLDNVMCQIDALHVEAETFVNL